ncbi:MAG TPA: hypothetical protein VGO49_22290 [Bradyrhizobium sp.]|nr:hypothetical protein [Bradyrhizobium sp.]
MNPQVNLEASTIERMKAYAEPLVDTLDTVILRGLDAIDMLSAKAKSPNAERVFNPASPPNLSYTTVKSIVWKGKRLPPAEAYWNPLMLIVIRESIKHMTKEQARILILCNKVTGRKEDNGYKYVEEIGLSIQGQDANNAWKTTYNILKAIKVPVEVIFAWQDNPKAVSPGAVGKFAVAFD